MRYLQYLPNAVRANSRAGRILMNSTIKKAAQLLLGAALTYAGISHLTTSRQTFQTQVPTPLKTWADQIVIASGLIEISLGISLIVLWKYRTQIGWIVALFFTAIFWGNISQFLNHTDAFGLNSDTARAVRLIFQPLLVIWALWSTGAWSTWRKSKTIYT